MKIAWFTPFSNASAIGKYSQVVTDYLAQEHEVDLWLFEQKQLHETNLKVVFYSASSQSFPDLESYDHIIYNMGNCPDFHAPIYEVLQKYPGIIIMHDVVMHSFFFHYYLDMRKEPASYLRDMEEFYGKRGRERATETLNGIDPVWLAEDVSQYPLDDRLLNSGKAIVVHSDYHARTIRKKRSGLPVYVVPLPYHPRKTGPPPVKVKDEFSVPDNKLILLSVGNVHPVKRIDKCIEAIGEDKDISGKVIYYIIGSYDGVYHEYLKSLAAKYDLSDCVHFLGYQPESVLQCFLDIADIFINLRYPNTEGGSWSLVEQMIAGKPVLVTNGGCYGEIPDGHVVKISRENERTDIGRSLKLLINSDQLRRKMGSSAKSFAEENHDVAVYCNRMMQNLAKVELNDSRLMAADILCSRIGQELANIRIQSDSILLERLSFELASIVHEDIRQPSSGCLTTLGVWYAFEYQVDLIREGITVFLRNLLARIIEKYGIRVEIWCYTINFHEIKKCFDNLLGDPNLAEKCLFICEDNCKQSLPGKSGPDFEGVQIDHRFNNLYLLANRYSQADCFLIGINYLENALYLNRPKVLPLHDLATFQYYSSFAEQNPETAMYVAKARMSVENFARAGAFFVSNSDFVRRNHGLKYIQNLSEDKTHFIYLPVNVPPDIQARIRPRDPLLEEYGIKGEYIFYPTQIRPYKNIVTLLKALDALVKEGYALELVLTGNLNDTKLASKFASENNLLKHIELARNVSEVDLYSLHTHAACTIVPTYFEGGLPWQALEAYLMETPVIMSKIPVTTERLLNSGIELNTPGLRLFEPDDAFQLCEMIKEVISDREKAVEEQRAIRNILLAYTWDDAIEKYYELFNRCIISS